MWKGFPFGSGFQEVCAMSKEGGRMTKVVRAFSLDPSVSEDLDFYTQVPGISKPMNKSRYVNEALKFYMGKNIKEMIEENKTLKRNLTAGIKRREKDLERINASQGVKHHLVGLLRCLNPFQRRKREEQPEQ